MRPESLVGPARRAGTQPGFRTPGSDADAFSDAGNLEQAVVRYRQALPYQPNDTALHTILGVGLLRLGRLKEAQAELESALRIDPNYQPARQALAAIQGK